MVIFLKKLTLKLAKAMMIHRCHDSFARTIYLTLVPSQSFGDER